MARSWALIHHAGIFTPPHHDADGYAVWIKVVAGSKAWCIIKPRNEGSLTKEEYLSALDPLTLEEGSGEGMDEDVGEKNEHLSALSKGDFDIEYVWLNPGDIL